MFVDLWRFVLSGVCPLYFLFGRKDLTAHRLVVSFRLNDSHAQSGEVN